MEKKPTEGRRSEPVPIGEIIDRLVEEIHAHRSGKEGAHRAPEGTGAAIASREVEDILRKGIPEENQ